MTDQPRLPMSDTVRASIRRLDVVHAIENAAPLVAPNFEGSVEIPERLRTYTPTRVAVYVDDTDGPDRWVTVSVMGPNARGETLVRTYSNRPAANHPLSTAPAWVRRLAHQTEHSWPWPDSTPIRTGTPTRAERLDATIRELSDHHHPVTLHRGDTACSCGGDRSCRDLRALTALQEGA